MTLSHQRQLEQMLGAQHIQYSVHVVPNPGLSWAPAGDGMAFRMAFNDARLLFDSAGALVSIDTEDDDVWPL
jgi:hypothetical protein